MSGAALFAVGAAIGLACIIAARVVAELRFQRFVQRAISEGASCDVRIGAVQRAGAIEAVPVHVVSMGGRVVAERYPDRRWTHPS